MQPWSRMYEAAMTAAGALSGLVLCVISLLISADVVMRNAGLGTMAWIVEVSEYSLPIATFLAAPWVLYKGGHVRIEILLSGLPRPVAAVLEIAADTIGAAISGAFLYYGLVIIAESRQVEAMLVKTLSLPEWWMLLPLPFSFALLAIEFVRRLARAAADLRSRHGLAR